MGVRPAKLAPERRQVRQSEDHAPKLTNWSDRRELRTGSRDVVNVARILSRADADSGSALNIVSSEFAPLNAMLGACLRV